MCQLNASYNVNRTWNVAHGYASSK